MQFDFDAIAAQTTWTARLRRILGVGAEDIFSYSTHQEYEYLLYGRFCTIGNIRDEFPDRYDTLEGQTMDCASRGLEAGYHVYSFSQEKSIPLSFSDVFALRQYVAFPEFSIYDPVENYAEGVGFDGRLVSSDSVCKEVYLDTSWQKTDEGGLFQEKLTHIVCHIDGSAHIIAPPEIKGGYSVSRDALIDASLVPYGFLVGWDFHDFFLNRF